MHTIVLGMIDIDVDEPPDMTGAEAVIVGRGSSVGVAFLLGSRGRVLFIEGAAWKVTGVQASATTGEDAWVLTVRLARV